LWKIQCQAKSTFAEASLGNNLLLQVEEEESESMHRVLEQSEKSAVCSDLNDNNYFSDVKYKDQPACSPPHVVSSSPSSSARGSTSKDSNAMILKSGILKKKGLIFNNKRLVTLT
jgi:hypothetical protein